MSEMVHKFTIAGLGNAPFRLTGIYELPPKSLAEANPTAYNNALAALPKGVGFGTCHYCGTGIMKNFEITSADGKRSVVGCDCIRKAGDHGLIKAVSLVERDKRRAKAAAARQVKMDAYRAAREAAQAEARAEAEANRPAFDEAFTALRANNAPIIEVLSLKTTTSHFCADMVKALCGHQAEMRMPKRVNDLYPRAQEIIRDIYAKAAGRSGSKAHEAALADFEARR